MAKYLFLKHYRGAPASRNDIPMDQWAPEEVEAHIQYMRDFATRLEGTGEYVGEEALSPEGLWVRNDGEGQPTVTDGPFAETKELVAGFWIWQCKSLAEAVDWVKRCPNPMPGPSDLEIRPIWESEDFGGEIAAGINELQAKIAKTTK